MAAIYSDEDVPGRLIARLCNLGHDVLTAHADGRANQGIDDSDVLIRATKLARTVLTKNGWDYHRLHRHSSSHAGIISFTPDPDYAALADRIHAAIARRSDLSGVLIRVVKGGTRQP